MKDLLSIRSLTGKALLFGLLVLLSCTRTSLSDNTGNAITLSADTLHFDTLFTSTGSVTHLFKVHNPGNRKLLINTIRLGGGEQSFFRINADGRAGPEVNGLEIEANDSLYVFVTVTIDPTEADLPFIVEDSVLILLQGNEQKVQLRAWGQNANFLHARVITQNTTWTAERPYVITGGLLVAENVTLAIEKGTRVYLHADAPLLVDGTLRAEGEPYDSTLVRFQGDRLDPYYRDFPGAWPGIYFRTTSRDNLLQHAVVKNAYQGIVTEGRSTNSNPKLRLEACIIDNCYDGGLIAVDSDIEAVNCLFSNCGKNILLVQGGEYRFTHCTNVAISNTYVQHKEPVLAISDFRKLGNDLLTAGLEAEFRNCIFWGENGLVEDEVVVAKEGNSTFNVNFSGCLWKMSSTPELVGATGIIANEDPAFEQVDAVKRVFDFRLKQGSPAIGAGVFTGVAYDLQGRERKTDGPDLGAYEAEW